MFNKLKIALIASPLLALSSGAFAATISIVTVTETEGGSGAPPVSTVSSNFVNDGNIAISGISGSNAEQNDDGTSDVEAFAGTLFSPEELATAEAQFVQNETNQFGMTRDYFLSFNLSAQEAAIYRIQGGLIGDGFISTGSGSVGPAQNTTNPFANNNPTVLTTSDYTAASFQYEITVNGNTVFDARADALVDDVGGFIDAGTLDDFTASIAPGLFFGEYTFTVDAISVSDLFIGSFNAFDPIEVVSTLTARAYANNENPFFNEEVFGNSVNAFSSDPIQLASIGFLTSLPTITVPGPTPVSEPSPIALLGAGAIAFGVLRRKKRKLVE